MIKRVFSVLFGCRHKRVTRPITPAHRPGTTAGTAYVACLDCGQQFHYDSKNMRIGEQIVSSAAAGPRGAMPFQSQY